MFVSLYCRFDKARLFFIWSVAKPPRFLWLRSIQFLAAASVMNGIY